MNQNLVTKSLIVIIYEDVDNRAALKQNKQDILVHRIFIYIYVYMHNHQAKIAVHFSTKNQRIGEFINNGWFNLSFTYLVLKISIEQTIKNYEQIYYSMYIYANIYSFC